jgi:hypothetical protein
VRPPAVVPLVTVPAFVEVVVDVVVPLVVPEFVVEGRDTVPTDIVSVVTPLPEVDSSEVGSHAVTLVSSDWR